MSVTDEKTLTGGWDGIADGVGVVTITPQLQSVEWRIGSTVSAPTENSGHTAARRQNVSLQLVSGERLYVKGSGSLTFTAENPV